jgi:tetratricopeptide (TPR) repeat protein
MRKRLTAWSVGLVMVLAALAPGWALQRTWAADADTGAAPKDDTKSSGSEALIARIEKQMGAVQDRMTELQNEEFKVSMGIMQAQQKATQALKDPAKAPDELAKGNKTRELLEYRNVMVQAAQAWQGFAEKFQRCVNMMKALERDREKAPADLQAKIDELNNKVDAKYRSLLEKAADCYDKVAEFRSALGIYLAIFQSIPEAKRATEKDLMLKIAGLYGKAGDVRNALATYQNALAGVPEKERFKDKKTGEQLANLYEKAGDLKSAFLTLKGTYEAVPEKDRYTKEKGLGEKLGGLYEKLGDYRSALELYKKLLEAIPADKREKDGKGLRDKIAACETKLGIKRTPVASSSGGSSNSAQKKPGPTTPGR